MEHNVMPYGNQTKEDKYRYISTKIFLSGLLAHILADSTAYFFLYFCDELPSV